MSGFRDVILIEESLPAVKSNLVCRMADLHMKIPRESDCLSIVLYILLKLSFINN